MMMMWISRLQSALSQSLVLYRVLQSSRNRINLTVVKGFWLGFLAIVDLTLFFS